MVSNNGDPDVSEPWGGIMEYLIEYIVNVNGLIFNGELDFDVEYENIKKVNIKQDERRMTHIKFSLNEGCNKDEAKKITEFPLDDILNNIAFNVENVVVGEIIEVRFLNEHADETKCCILVRQPKSEEELVETIINIEKGFKYVNVKHKLFRAAMLSKDEVARFINLYGILYMIKGNQDKVDNYIDEVKEELGITVNYTEPHPYSKRNNSTEYTYYRNKIAHMDENMDYSKLRKLSKDIGVILPDFIKIVKKSIEDSIK